METLASIDFFAVPTAFFDVLIVFVVLAHDRQPILSINVTSSPSAAWTANQIVHAFPWESAPRYLLRDRDGIYSAVFRHRVRGLGIEEARTARRSPLRTPYVDRVIGTLRRELVDHVIVMNERHLRRLLRRRRQKLDSTGGDLGEGRGTHMLVEAEISNGPATDERSGQDTGGFVSVTNRAPTSVIDPDPGV